MSTSHIPIGNQECQKVMAAPRQIEGNGKLCLVERKLLNPFARFSHLLLNVANQYLYQNVSLSFNVKVFHKLNFIIVIGIEQEGVSVVQQGKLMKTFFQWGKYFHISLDVTVEQVPQKIMNIFHFMTNDEDFKYPALWITPDQKFYFEYDVNNYYNYQQSFELYKSYKLAIRKFEEDGDYKLQIAVDGNLVYETTAVKEDEVTSVKYYLSQPWGEAFTKEYGKVENVMIISDEGCEYQDPKEGFKPF